MTLLGMSSMIVDLQSFLTGVRALRNSRDWAKGQRQKLVDAANAKSRASLPAAN